MLQVRRVGLGCLSESVTWRLCSPEHRREVKSVYIPPLARHPPRVDRESVISSARCIIHGSGEFLVLKRLTKLIAYDQKAEGSLQ